MSRRRKYTYDITDMHSFLIDKHGDLLDTAEKIPDVRRHIESLPKTAATFKIKQIDSFDDGHMNNVFMEFAGSWKMPEKRSLKETRFVNPNYKYTHRYSDMVVECECGAKIVHNYESDSNPTEKEHDHADSCMSFDRLRARASMSEMRYNAIRRLSWLGWKGVDIERRAGLSRGEIGSIARSFGFKIRDLYDHYRRSAGMTYAYFVHEKGLSAQRIADIYGHSKSTLGRWYKEYSDFEPVVDADTKITFKH